MSQIANLATILSLLCGFSSLILSSGSNFVLSAYAVLLAVILDGIDGQLARKNKVSSAFGKELDSLVDVVSFGVAPSLLGYLFIYDNLHFLSVAALFIYIMCAVVRLARYNIITKEEKRYYFSGLPTTVSGGILVSYILACIEKDRFSPLLFVLLVLLLAYLMVSRARYLNLDGIKQVLGFSLKPAILSLIIALGIAFYLKKPGLGLLSVFLIYLIFSPFVVKRLDNN